MLCCTSWNGTSTNCLPLPCCGAGRRLSLYSQQAFYQLTNRDALPVAKLLRMRSSLLFFKSLKWSIQWEVYGACVCVRLKREAALKSLLRGPWGTSWRLHRQSCHCSYWCHLLATGSETQWRRNVTLMWTCHVLSETSFFDLCHVLFLTSLFAYTPLCEIRAILIIRTWYFLPWSAWIEVVKNTASTPMSLFLCLSLTRK